MGSASDADSRLRKSPLLPLTEPEAITVPPPPRPESSATSNVRKVWETAFPEEGDLLYGIKRKTLPSEVIGWNPLGWL